jgi:hypothetical protein
MRIEFEVRVNAALDDFCSIWKFNMAARVNYAFWLAENGILYIVEMFIGCHIKIVLFNL